MTLVLAINCVVAAVLDLQVELKRVLGVDLTRIDGIQVMTAQTVYAELGPDLGAAFPSEDHFASWLVPRPKAM